MYGHENLSFYWRNSYPQSFLLDFLLSGYFYDLLEHLNMSKKFSKSQNNVRIFFCSLRSQNMLKIAKICRKYVKYLKYVIFLKNGKICKNIFFTYLHILFESSQHFFQYYFVYFFVCAIEKTSEIYTIFLWISMYKSGSLFLLS